jgi:hypothetical protein
LLGVKAWTLEATKCQRLLDIEFRHALLRTDAEAAVGRAAESQNEVLRRRIAVFGL